MAGDFLRRTAITRPILTGDQRDLLEETISEWQTACNISSRIGWESEVTQKTKLQDLAYDIVRDRTRLGSQHAVLATHQAAAALSGVKKTENLEEDYKTSCPEFTSNTVKYDARSMTVFDDGSVSLATTGGRIRCDLALPTDENGYQSQAPFTGRGQLTSRPAYNCLKQIRSTSSSRIPIYS